MNAPTNTIAESKYATVRQLVAYLETLAKNVQAYQNGNKGWNMSEHKVVFETEAEFDEALSFLLAFVEANNLQYTPVNVLGAPGLYMDSPRGSVLITRRATLAETEAEVFRFIYPQTRLVSWETPAALAGIGL